MGMLSVNTEGNKQRDYINLKGHSLTFLPQPGRKITVWEVKEVKYSTGCQIKSAFLLFRTETVETTTISSKNTVKVNA